MSNINFQHLMYFREIARHGSISKASDALLISAPALSSQLKILEDFVGQNLFDREGRSLVINEFGKNVLEYAEKIFSTGEDLLHFVNNPSFTQDITIKLGFNDSLPKVLIRDIVLRVKKEFKDVSFKIFEDNNDELKKKLYSHDLDMIFTNRKIYDDEGKLKSRNFLKQKISIYGSEKFKKLSKGFPQSLDNVPLILPNLHSEMRNTIDHWFIDNKLHYRLAAEIHDSSVKKILAIYGVGVVPLPENGAANLIKEKKIKKIGELSGVYERYYWTAKKVRTVKNPIVDFLMEIL